MNSPEVAVENRHEESNKVSPDNEDTDGMQSPEQENIKKKLKKKKSKKSKKTKKKDYTDENYNKKVKQKSNRKMADSEKSITNKLEGKPLVPYANADDTSTDDSAEKTEVVEDSKRIYQLEREIGGVGEEVSKQGTALDDYSDNQISRKTTESSSSMPESCRWKKGILKGNDDILEDIEVLNSNLEAENADTQEFARTEKPKVDGGRNMLKRALASIIEKEKPKVRELREVPDVKQKKRKTKKKRKRRRELSNDEDSDEKSTRKKKQKAKKVGSSCVRKSIEKIIENTQDEKERTNKLLR